MGGEVGERGLRHHLESHLTAALGELGEANAAREQALPACRQAIQLCGRSIKCVHRLEPTEALRLAADAERAVRTAQAILAPFPALTHAGFLHDAEKEYVEARCVAALVAGDPVPGPAELDVGVAAWMRGLAEAASELRRHLLDRLRDGELERAEALLAAMDDVYDALIVVDFPDALTGGLRRTLDSLRAVLERSRGDVTTTALQTRLQRSIESHPAAP